MQWILEIPNGYITQHRDSRFRPLKTSLDLRRSTDWSLAISEMDSFIDGRPINAYVPGAAVFADGTSTLSDELVYECLSCVWHIAMITESGSYITGRNIHRPAIVKTPVELVGLVSFTREGLVGRLADDSLVLISGAGANDWASTPYKQPIPHVGVVGDFGAHLSVRISQVTMLVDAKFLRNMNKYLFVCSVTRQPIIARAGRRGKNILVKIPTKHVFTVIDMAHGFVLGQTDDGQYDAYDFLANGQLKLARRDIRYDPPAARHKKPAL